MVLKDDSVIFFLSLLCLQGGKVHCIKV